MADIANLPMENYGQMLSTLPLANQQIQQSQSQQAVNQAEVPLIGAQAQGAELQNQYTAMRNAWLKQGMPFLQQMQQNMAQGQQQQQGNLTDMVDPSTGAILDPSMIRMHAQQQFQVPNVWTPQQNAMLQWAAQGRLFGVPDLDTNIKMQHDAMYQTAAENAKVGANKAYQESSTIGKIDPSAPAGTVQQALRNINPQYWMASQQLKQKFGWDDATTDRFIRNFEDERGNAVFQYTGMTPTMGRDGVLRGPDGRKVAGLSPARRQDQAAHSGLRIALVRG